MSRQSETIRYYDENADEYVRDTVGVNMNVVYEPFLQAMPAGTKILDAGCGSGRDAKAFLERGYEVTAIDGSTEMVAATGRLTGTQARQQLLQDIDFENEFDGVWACASLLHVPRSEMDDVFQRIAHALKPGGVCYASFKEGDDERSDGGRLFTDFTSASLRAFIADHREFEIVRVWGTDDVRPEEHERWVNALLRKVGELTCDIGG